MTSEWESEYTPREHGEAAGPAAKDVKRVGNAASIAPIQASFQNLVPR